MIRRLLARIVYLGGNVNRITGWHLSRFNRWIYKLTGGVLGNVVPGTPVILLTTTGRKTGKPHTVPVAAWPSREGDLIVGNGAGGSPKIPHWYLNLKANPNAQVQLKRESFDAEATFLDPDEHERFVQSSSDVVKFYDSVGRRRPSLVRLTRRV